MRLSALAVALILAASPIRAAIPTVFSQSLTLQTIFGKNAVQPDQLISGKWKADGSNYTMLEPAVSGGRAAR